MAGILRNFQPGLKNVFLKIKKHAHVGVPFYKVCLGSSNSDQ